MSAIANLATYPARLSQSIQAISSISPQVDVVNVVLNGYKDVPSELKSLPKVRFISPPKDLRDVGKFYPDVEDEDDVFLCDDDIVYPQDYVNEMRSFRVVLEDVLGVAPVVGAHGVIYSDYYDGKPRSGRLVDVFHRKLERFRLVNQLGTGTVFCKGFQLPGFEFMKDSHRFVDVRFARHALKHGYPMVCVPRDNGWMKQIEVASSIYEDFTESHPVNVVLEIQEIAGFSNLDHKNSSILAGL